MQILANTYFSGAGLMDIGLQSGGLTLQQSFEIEAVWCETQRRNFSHEVVQCDITKKLVQSEKECHVMVATYPCTKYSPIADIHGVRTGDDLFLHRLIIIGSRRNFAWREPEAERAVTLAEILEPDPAPHIPEYVSRRLAGKYRDRPIVSDPARGDIAPTCVAHYSKDLSTRLVVDQRFPHGARPYTVREYARLQGVPDTFTFAGSDNDAYRMIGNGVSVPVGNWIGSEITRYFQ